MGKGARSEIKALAVARPFSTCKVFINTVLFQMAALGPRSAYSPGRMHGEIKTGDLTQFFCFVALSTNTGDLTQFILLQRPPYLPGTRRLVF